MHLHSSPGLLLFYFLGQAASSWRGKGDSVYGEGQGDSTGDLLSPALHLWPVAPRVSPGRQTLNETTLCKNHWPGRCPCSPLILTFPERSRDDFCMHFLCKAGWKGGRHTLIFLLPSFPLVLSQRPSASQGHRGRRIFGRMEDQVCSQRLLFMCWPWERLAQGGAELSASRWRAAHTNLPELKGLDNILPSAALDQNN